MAFKMSERDQFTFLPPVIADYIGKQDPVRIYNAFVDALDFNKLGISLIPKAGTERYNPRQMVKLLVYGYSYGIRSSRHLERACHHNLSFIWLMANLKPDFRTIARFRSDHKDAVKKIFKQCVRMCVDMDLIEGNTLFLDGSKFRANASLDNTYSREHLAKELKKAEEDVSRLIDECERLDQDDYNKPSLVESKKELCDKERLAKHLEQCLAKADESGSPSVNITDADCTTAKTRQGTHAVHNVQCVTDDKHGLIVQVDAVGAPNDSKQLLPQLKQSIENIGHKPAVACADAGFFSPQEFEKIDKDVTVIMPSPMQAHEDKTEEKTAPGPFDKAHFTYNKKRDEYICPGGKNLPHRGVDPERPHRHIYQAKASDCRSCPRWGKCTNAANGRKVIRSEYEDIIKRQEKIYASEHNQAIYKLRKQKIEHPFGHFKRNLNAGQFLLRGKNKVTAEISILATCFNIARMTTILGMPHLMTCFQHI